MSQQKVSIGQALCTCTNMTLGFSPHQNPLLRNNHYQPIKIISSTTLNNTTLNITVIIMVIKSQKEFLTHVDRQGSAHHGEVLLKVVMEVLHTGLALRLKHLRSCNCSNRMRRVSVKPPSRAVTVSRQLKEEREEGKVVLLEVKPRASA